MLKIDCLPNAVGKAAVHTLDLSWKSIDVKLMMMIITVHSRYFWQPATYQLMHKGECYLYFVRILFLIHGLSDQQTTEKQKQFNEEGYRFRKSFLSDQSNSGRFRMLSQIVAGSVGTPHTFHPTLDEGKKMSLCTLNK